MKTLRTRLVPTVSTLLLLGLLTACGGAEQHAQNDLSDKWWSDHYYSMLGNQQASLARPKPLKLQ